MDDHAHAHQQQDNFSFPRRNNSSQLQHTTPQQQSPSYPFPSSAQQQQGFYQQPYPFTSYSLQQSQFTQRPTNPAPASNPSPPQPSPLQTKRKRKSTDNSLKSTDEDQPDPVQPSHSDSSHKKRTKTQRACDSCRSRKIRCDVIIDSDPPTCQHCKQYTFDCTFFLPITETRFKKKRGDEPASTPAPSTNATPASSAVTRQQPQPPPARSPMSAERDRDSDRDISTHKGEVKVMGPTSATYLLHSTASVPVKAYDSFDLKYHHRWEVGRGVDGVIQVLEQPDASAGTPLDVAIRVDSGVLQNLLNTYFDRLSPILPIINQEEFLALCSSSPPPPILLYSMAVVAAAHRDVSSTDFDALRNAVNSVLKAEDVLSNATMTNVKALLILGMCSDAHGSFVPKALSALWIRLGTAIRMAQDLGLHRTEAVQLEIEMRRRLWAACVISDRWCSLTYGHPFMIDVQDCDARLPSSGNPNDAYLDEMVRLSILLGKVLKMIYSPTGLTQATDEGLRQLLSEIDRWKESLPPVLKYQGPTSSIHSGLLHLLYGCVCMLFWRVFMRISYICPPHLKFGLTVERWTELVTTTRESIEWIDQNEEIYDYWVIVPYAATSCALVQYHTYARRRDPEAQAALKMLRDCVQRWEKAIEPEHMSTRRKTAEIITLLYETTLSPDLPSDSEIRPLNPTAGVTSKVPSTLKGVAYKADPSRPGGGVFVAEKKRIEQGDLPTSAFITREEADGEDAEKKERKGQDKEKAKPKAASGSDVEMGNGSAHDSTGRKHASYGAGEQIYANLSAGSMQMPLSLVSGSANSIYGSLTNGFGYNGHGGHGYSVPATTDGVPYLFSSRPPQGATGGVIGLPSQHTHSQLQHHQGPAATTEQQQHYALSHSHLYHHHNLNPSLQSSTPLLNLSEHSSYPQVTDQSILNALVGNEQILDGLPGSMFDWEQWDTYFSRFPALSDAYPALSAIPPGAGADSGSRQTPSRTGSGSGSGPGTTDATPAPAEGGAE